VLLLRRPLRHGAPCTIVVPETNASWLTEAVSLAETLFCNNRVAAVRALAPS